jgi:hypothetical protein
MINSLRAHVVVNLDKPRKMAFTMNAIADVEEVLDIPVISGENADHLFKRMKEGRTGLRVSRALLWAGLKVFEPELTVEQVGEILTLKKLAEANDGITKAMALFFQQQGVEINEAEEIPLPTTGSGSGPSPEAPAA